MHKHTNATDSSEDLDVDFDLVRNLSIPCFGST